MKWTISCETCDAHRRRDLNICGGCDNPAPIDGTPCQTCAMIAAADAN